MPLNANGNEIADPNAGGTGGTGDEGAKGNEDTTAAMQGQIGVLTKAVTLMAQSQQETQELLKNLPEMLKASHPAIDEGGDHSSSGDLFEGVDLDTLNRKEYGTLLLTKFMERLSSHMDEKLKPVTAEITSVRETFATDLGNRQVNETLAAHKDLYEWKDEIRAILKDAPSMKISRALVIAKSENPEKTAAMVKKYAASGEDDKNKVRYLSMTPTSRTAGDDGSKGKMKFADAAEHAFDDVVASFGGSSFDQLMGSGRR